MSPGLCLPRGCESGLGASAASGQVPHSLQTQPPALSRMAGAWTRGLSVPGSPRSQTEAVSTGPEDRWSGPADDRPSVSAWGQGSVPSEPQFSHLWPEEDSATPPRGSGVAGGADSSADPSLEQGSPWGLCVPAAARPPCPARCSVQLCSLSVLSHPPAPAHPALLGHRLPKALWRSGRPQQGGQFWRGPRGEPGSPRGGGSLKLPGFPQPYTLPWKPPSNHANELCPWCAAAVWLAPGPPGVTLRSQGQAEDGEPWGQLVCPPSASFYKTSLPTTERSPVVVLCGASVCDSRGHGTSALQGAPVALPAPC